MHVYKYTRKIYLSSKQEIVVYFEISTPFATRTLLQSVNHKVLRIFHEKDLALKHFEKQNNTSKQFDMILTHLMQ